MKRLTWLVVLLPLAACGGGGGPGAVPVAVSLPDAQAASPAKPAASPPTAADLRVDPSRLKGTRPADVKVLLGEPDFVRRERPAEIWQYYGQGCILDLFFYTDSGDKNVAHVELRARGATKAADPRCLSDLFDKRRPPSS